MKLGGRTFQKDGNIHAEMAFFFNDMTNVSFLDKLKEKGIQAFICFYGIDLLKTSYCPERKSWLALLATFLSTSPPRMALHTCGVCVSCEEMWSQAF